MLKAYYNLAKPGIVYGNLLTTVAAYLYASHWQFGWNFLAVVVGLGLVIASACVFNNYFDREIDQNMRRTRERALASGAISTVNALLFGALLGLIGLTLLVAFVNILSAAIAVIGFIVYVFVYTFSKRATSWATEIGSISGAVPIVVGYTAVTNHVDWTAFILFLTLVFWQMPHFYAISMYRSGDYAAAHIPVLSLTKGIRETKKRSLYYIIAFSLAVFALTYFGFAGFLYLTITEVAAFVWFWRAESGFRADDTEAWARTFFFTSLYVLLVFSLLLSVAAILP